MLSRLHLSEKSRDTALSVETDRLEKTRALRQERTQVTRTAVRNPFKAPEAQQVQEPTRESVRATGQSLRRLEAMIRGPGSVLFEELVAIAERSEDGMAELVSEGKRIFITVFSEDPEEEPEHELEPSPEPSPDPVPPVRPTPTPVNPPKGR